MQEDIQWYWGEVCAVVSFSVDARGGWGAGAGFMEVLFLFS